MNWTEAIAQWLHVLFGTFWFGGMLFSNLVVIPAIMRLSADGQREFVKSLAEQAGRVVPLMAGGAIVLGIIRGTILGDIKSVDDLGTTYGIEWIVGLVAALATFAWGTWVLQPSAERLNTEPGANPADQAARVARVRMLAMLELLGFFVIFTTMILMHYAGEA